MEKIDYKKRYYVVYLSEFYPAGFLNDVEDTFDTIEEAIEFAKNKFIFGYYDIYDRIECEFIELDN